jgi:DNA-binding CsgD family transcriptional regulator
MQVFEQNRIAFQYQEAIIHQFLEICKPLKILEIPLFSYARFYPDGTFFSVKTDLERQKEYFEKLKSNTPVWGETCIKTGDESLEMAIWPQKPNLQIEAMAFSYEKNMWNGVSFIRKLPDSIENWCFVGHKESTQLQNFCLRNKEVLRQFIEYFNQAASSIIQIDDQNGFKLAKFENGLVFPEVSCEQEKINSFLKKLNLQFPKLTSKESECLYYLALGNTSKQIANHMGIEKRTVDTHLENIRLKVGKRLRSELIQFYRKHFVF